MKYMTLRRKQFAFDLQFFAEEDTDDDGTGAGDGDDQDDDESDGDGEEEEEKLFSQRDVDEAVKKRLARERRKWQREQKKNTGKKDILDDSDKKDEKEDPEKQEAINKATNLEVKVACYEAGVVKDAVDDVAALARAYMAADEDLDLEDAIEKVVKKYPQFKNGAKDPYEEDDEPKKAWGERQKGKGKKTSGVEDAFLRKNPGLKID